MNVQQLQSTAQALVADGKGILAADESTGTIKKRFDSIGVESTEETRRAYRELLFTTSGAEEFIGGVILYDETIRQQTSDGTAFPKLLESKGIVPGIKVDEGAKPLALAEGETVTEGLDGLRDQRVHPEGILLKPNMVLPGYESSEQVSDEEIAHETARCFLRHVPAAVPGIVFLSGGQSEEEATRRLNAINAVGPHPWKVSFSYGRALQAGALKAWGGHDENVEAAQRAFYHRAKMNSAAQTGTYAPDMEKEAVPA